MTPPPRPLAAILRDIQASASLLEAAERDWPDALLGELFGEDVPEVPRIEDLLHWATHETAGQLAMALLDIETLLRRVDLRRKYSMFSTEQFERIVREGWSTRLAHELHEAIPSMTLVEVSAHVKQLCAAWDSLRRVASANRPIEIAPSNSEP